MGIPNHLLTGILQVWREDGDWMSIGVLYGEIIQLMIQAPSPQNLIHIRSSTGFVFFLVGHRKNML